MTPADIRCGDVVIHRLDPLRRERFVVSVFRWLGQWKVKAADRDGEYMKDWEHEWEKK